MEKEYKFDLFTNLFSKNTLIKILVGFHILVLLSLFNYLRIYFISIIDNLLHLVLIILIVLSLIYLMKYYVKKQKTITELSNDILNNLKKEPALTTRWMHGDYDFYIPDIEHSLDGGKASTKKIKLLNCPTCGELLIYNSEKDLFYCKKCKNYLEKE